MTDNHAHDLDALIERLKDDAVPSGGRWQVRQDAAAALVQLLDRIAALEAERDALLGKPMCGYRGFAGPTCCVLVRDHSGEHKYGDPEQITIARVIQERDALEAERKGLKQDAERWSAVVMLWLMSTELTLTQDEDGRYSITCVEPVEALPAPGRWTGDDPDAAIDAARSKP